MLMYDVRPFLTPPLTSSVPQILPITINMSTESLTIVYWEIMARAFPIEAQLLAGGIEYDYDRDTANSGAYKEVAPFGQVPLLKVGEAYIAQSGAQARYAGRKAFPPKDEKEALVVDMYMEQAMDVFGGVATTASIKDDTARAAAWTVYETEGIAKILTPLVAAVKKNGGAFLLGDKCSAADVTLFSTMHLYISAGADSAPAFKAFPEVKSIYDAVMGMGNVKAHCDKNLTPHYTKK
jgi:glutathione S-transferase